MEREVDVMKTLVDIMVEYNLRNDTHYEFGTDKEFHHRYCSNFYDEFLAPYRDKELKLLEIGVHRGGSLAVWHHYFPNASILGLDVVDHGAKSNCASYPRINVVFADGYDNSFVSVLPSFDIVIDDGPHTKESHLKALSLYPSKLNPGGVFIIEDILQMEWAEEYKSLIPPEMTCGIADIRQPSNTSDSIIFWVKNEKPN
jgi:hypothetical protein